MADTPLTIAHNVDRHRFEATIGDETARAEYAISRGVMHVRHTEVPPAFQGRGIAAGLVRAAIAYAREKGLRVVPDCPYARSYMQRHPDTHALLPDHFEF